MHEALLKIGLYLAYGAVNVASVWFTYPIQSVNVTDFFFLNKYKCNLS